MLSSSTVEVSTSDWVFCCVSWAVDSPSPVAAPPTVPKLSSEIEVPPLIHQSTMPLLEHLPKPSGIGRGAEGFPSWAALIKVYQILKKNMQELSMRV